MRRSGRPLVLPLLLLLLLLEASSRPVACARAEEENGGRPHGLHIALSSRSSSPSSSSSPPSSSDYDEEHYYYHMMISWSTDALAESVVYWGTSTDGETRTQNEEGPVQYIYGDDGSYTSPFLHHVRIGPLRPGTGYSYRVGDDHHGLSKKASFLTPPAVGVPGNALSFAVVGDVGQTDNSLSTLTSMRGVVAGENDLKLPKPSLWLHPGDIAYADCDQRKWDSFMELVSPLAQTLPWMVGPGNHEVEVELASGLAFTAFEARFRMPGTERPSIRPEIPDLNRGECAPSTWAGLYNGGNAYYSFDAGLVHFVSLNAYTDHSAGAAQKNWLERDLASVDRSKTPWIVAQYHCPWYSSNFDHQHEPQTVSMRRELERIFQAYRVAVTFSGHVHAYERTHPVLGWERDPEGPVHITIGSGGNHEGHANQWFPSPAWSALRDGKTFGFGVATVANATHLEWNFVGGAGEGVVERVWISNPYVHVRDDNHSAPDLHSNTST